MLDVATERPDWDINPSGKCMGADMKGCPHNADAPPHRREGAVVHVRYHCDRCFPAYCAKQDSSPG